MITTQPSFNDGVVRCDWIYRDGRPIGSLWFDGRISSPQWNFRTYKWTPYYVSAADNQQFATRDEALTALAKP